MVAERIAAGKWQELEDVFWTTIPFGTGGRRGKLYPIGTNAINDRTIGESAEGLADYVREVVGKKPLACAIAYDTRHRSRDFAELSPGSWRPRASRSGSSTVSAAHPRSRLLFATKSCDCGIMITASHNPPTDNALKVYWLTGGQLLPPHDEGVIERVYRVKEISRIPWAEGLALGSHRVIVRKMSIRPSSRRSAAETPGLRGLKIIYSPLHGVVSAVCPVLRGGRIRRRGSLWPYASPDPDFTNIPGHVANPENAVVFDAIIARGNEIGAD